MAQGTEDHDDKSETVADRSIELEKLRLDRYKARLDFWKFIWVSGCAAVLIAAIPPSFQFATARLEGYRLENQLKLDQVNKESDRKKSIEEFRNTYAKDFIERALSQDIELRVRFAEYFSFVAAGDFKEDWEGYLKKLRSNRDQIRKEIDKMEREWQQANPKTADYDELSRHLSWAYKEVGYVERNRSADPRTQTDSREIGISLSSIPAQRRDIAQKILDAFSAAGYGQIQQVAALANAIAESGLDPNVQFQNEIGLFLLNRSGGLGTGKTAEELMNPDTNINLMVDAAKKVLDFEKATSLEDAVAVFVRKISRPSDFLGAIEKRTRIARQILRS